MRPVSAVPLLVVALTLAPAAASAATKPADQVRLSGRLSVTHDDTGLQANGASCGLATPDNTTPFADHYTVSVSWSTSFTVPFNPGRELQVRLEAARTRVSGNFSYSGFAYDFSCHEIVYGPGGQPCTGSLSAAAARPAAIKVRQTPRRTRERLRLEPQPFGALIGDPASCTVDATPQVTYAAADELSLSSLGATVAGRTFSVLESAGRHKPVKRGIHLRVNCSAAPESAGETDTCSTVYAGNETLSVRRG